MSSKPGLLFLCHRIPYPPDKGEKIRAWHMFEHLAQSYRMHLGCFVDDPADQEHDGYLRSMCEDMLCIRLDKRRQKLLALLGMRPGRSLTQDYFRSAAMQNWVQTKLANREVEQVFVFSSGMAGYVMDCARPGMILDMVDVDSEKWAEYARRSTGLSRLVWAREGRTLLNFERQAVRHFARTLFVSQDECRRFVTLAPESEGRIDWVENGVDLERFSPEQKFENPFPDARPRIVFTGTMDYWPNVDAVTWFAREVMPRLRERAAADLPLFCVVGANPGSEVKILAKSGALVTGRVTDVRPYLAHATIAVAPLRLARGIQNKLLEGMAMGRPVVASPQAFEGVSAEAGRDLLVADGAVAMARAIDEVFDGKHPGLGEAGRRAVESCYAWPATLQRLDDLLAKLRQDGHDMAPISHLESRT
jgi:sugar transferase (PEP-CTERM/EpsH1 system associated)